MTAAIVALLAVGPLVMIWLFDAKVPQCPNCGSRATQPLTRILGRRFQMCQDCHDYWELAA